MSLERRSRPSDETRAAHDVDDQDDTRSVTADADVEHAKRILAILRAHPRPPRRPGCPCGHDPADDASCIRHTAGLAELDWAAVTGVFVPHQGGVRLVSLRDAARWAA